MPLELHKELVKRVHYNATKDEDMKDYYKAYQMGAFKSMNPDLAPELTYSFEEFLLVLGSVLKRNNLLSVTFYVNKQRIGSGFFWQRSDILEVAHMVWFPWASKRQIFESFLNFFEAIRRTVYSETNSYFKVIEFASQKDVKFFDKFVEMGVLQKVGKMLQSHHEGDDYTVIYATLTPNRRIN